MHLATSSKHVSRETNVRRCNKSTGAPWTKTTSRNLKLTREVTHTCADATKEDRPRATQKHARAVNTKKAKVDRPSNAASNST